LPENGLDSGQLCSAKKKNSARRYYKSIGQKPQSSPKSETLMERNGKGQLFLLGASPASLSLLPGQKQARRMTVTSGHRCCELLRKQSLVGYLQRMCLESSTWHSTRCYLTWKAKVTPQGRLLFQLVASMPRTEGIESGLLLTTPNPSDQGRKTKYQQRGTALSAQIAMLPTPSVKDMSGGAVKAIPTKRGWHRISKQGKKHGAQLHDVIKILPTPTSRDFRSEKCSDKTFDRNPRPLSETLGKKTGMKLQPAFVEWMMGFPIGFTDLKHSATQSSPKSHTKS